MIFSVTGVFTQLSYTYTIKLHALCKSIKTGGNDQNSFSNYVKYDLLKFSPQNFEISQIRKMLSFLSD